MVPTDYKEFSEHDIDKTQFTTTSCRVKWTTAVAAHVAQAKGSIEASKKIVEFFDSFCCSEIVLKFDNEVAIEVLSDDVINEGVRPTRPADPVPTHPQTH